jgi:hypothetical protein
MNNFIDYSYFVGNKSIPNLDKDPTAFDANYIAVYQKEILIKLLGYNLYLAFEAGLDVTPTPLAIWTDLRDGSTYTVDSINTQNPGCKDIVANYVYCKYVSANYEQLTGLGSTSANGINATNVSPENKMIKAWNNMYRDYYLVYNFISNNESDYPNWDFEYITKMLYGF